MNIIEIATLDNGAHRNQNYNGVIPPDWGETAFIREDVSTLKNFPFGEVTAEEVDGVMVMTEWTPGEIPEPAPESEPVPTAEEDTAAMLVDHEFRLTMLELGLTE